MSNNVSDTLRKYGVNDSSYYRWKAKYGGMDSKSIQRLRELERENARLKHIVADQMLDKAHVETGGSGDYQTLAIVSDGMATSWGVDEQQTFNYEDKNGGKTNEPSDDFL